MAVTKNSIKTRTHKDGKLPRVYKGLYSRHREEHLDRYGVKQLPDELLYDWYVRSQPTDLASPLRRMVCSLIEELADLRKMKLPNAHNTIEVPTWRTI